MLEISNCAVNIEIKSDLFSENSFIKFSETILPSVKRVTTPRSNYDLICVTCLRGENILQVDKNCITIQGNYNSKQIMRDAVMFTSILLETILNSRNKFSVHSSSLSNGEHSIIFAGNSGSGKTSIALFTNYIDKDFKFISGDRTIISTDGILAGTEVVNARRGILEIIPSKYSKNLRKNSWSHIYKIRPTIPKYKYLPIKAIYFPYILEINNLEIHEYSGDDKFLSIFYAMDYFTNSFPSICLGQKRKFPIDNNIQNIQKKKIDFVKYLVESIPTYRIIGTMEKISEYIIMKHKKAQNANKGYT